MREKQITFTFCLEINECTVAEMVLLNDVVIVQFKVIKSDFLVSRSPTGTPARQTPQSIHHFAKPSQNLPKRVQNVHVQSIFYFLIGY